MGNLTDDFFEFREEINEKILDTDNLSLKRFFELDSRVYREGELSSKIKEMLGLVASLVLKCDECIYYHLDRCRKEGVTREEFQEIFSIALVAGGSIVIPHVRKAVKFLEELAEKENTVRPQKNENQDKENNELDFAKNKKDTIHLFTDGACIDNPGPGAYAAIKVINGREIELSGFEEETTNNRMELKAVIEGLKAIKAENKVTKVVIYSDSNYVIKGITNWIFSWKNNNWHTSGGNQVKNKNLWKELDRLTVNQDYEFKKIKAHSGIKYNEKVDKLAKETIEENI